MVGIAVSIPTEITGIDKMTVKEFHIVDDSGSITYSVDNVAKAMNDIKEQLETLTEKFYGVGSGITLNRISKE
jgi:archaellum component FlaC